MVQINLLAWREQAVKVKQTRFIVLLVFTMLLAFVLLIIFHFYYSAILSRQLDRNNYLQTALGQEQTQLNSLIAKKKELLQVDSALHFIIDLREQSYHAIELLDAITRATPESITVNKITREDNMITLDAKANSDADISALIENLTKMKIFKQPVLTIINAKQSSSGDDVIFELKVEQQG